MWIHADPPPCCYVHLVVNNYPLIWIHMLPMDPDSNPGTYFLHGFGSASLQKRIHIQYIFKFRSVIKVHFIMGIRIGIIAKVRSRYRIKVSNSCSLLLLPISAPYFCTLLLLFTPAPNSCSLLLLLTPAPYSCSLVLLQSPAPTHVPYTRSLLLLFTPALLLLLFTPSPYSCSCLLPGL